MAEVKLDNTHRHFILLQRAMFVYSNKLIADRLLDPEIAEEYGFEPVEISQQRICQIVRHETPKKEIDDLRKKWLADLEDNPLVHKKKRLQELLEMYRGADKDDFARYDKDGNEINTGEAARKTFKAGILRQIKDELGEDWDKLMEAMRRTQAPQINVLNLMMLGNYGDPTIPGITGHLRGQLETARRNGGSPHRTIGSVVNNGGTPGILPGEVPPPDGETPTA